MNYREHLTLNTAILIPTAYLADRDLPLGIIGLFLFGYAIGSTHLSPDLDCHSQPFKNWSILKFVWKPYQLLPHRSIFTHAPLLGTVGRVIYIHVAATLPLCGVLLAFQYLGAAQFQSSLEAILERYMSTITNNPKGVMAMLLGLELSAMGHLLGDLSSTILKKTLKPITRSKKATKTSKPQALALP